jgi:hypothetical protein
MAKPFVSVNKKTAAVKTIVKTAPAEMHFK